MAGEMYFCVNTYIQECPNIVECDLITHAHIHKGLIVCNLKRAPTAPKNLSYTLISTAPKNAHIYYT